MTSTFSDHQAEVDRMEVATVAYCDTSPAARRRVDLDWIAESAVSEPVVTPDWVLAQRIDARPASVLARSMAVSNQPHPARSEDHDVVLQ